jgi:hypothetical protein
MYHTLNNIADNNFLDRAKFFSFVHMKMPQVLDKYGMISTWECNDVVEAFKLDQGNDAIKQYREEKVKAYENCYPTSRI